MPPSGIKIKQATAHPHVGRKRHPVGQDHLAQAQELPADEGREAEKQGERREHQAHFLIAAQNRY